MGQIQPDYEWDARTYHQVSDPQFNMAMELVAEIDLRGDETVVDAGCGTGRAAEQILPRLPEGRMILVDRSKNMLDMARLVLLSRYRDRVEFIEADLQIFCAPDRAHGVFSNFAMHFVPDHALMFKNLFRSLRPGGFFAANIAGSKLSKRPPFAALQRILREPQYKPYAVRSVLNFYGADVEATEQKLLEAGFEDVHVREETMEMQPVSGPQQEGWHAKFMPLLISNLLARLPTDAMREELKERVIEAARRESASSGFDGECVICHARRPR